LFSPRRARSALGRRLNGGWSVIQLDRITL